MPWVMEGTDYYDGSHVTCNRTRSKSDDDAFPSAVKVLSDANPTELWAAAKLAELLELPGLAGLPSDAAFRQRDALKAMVAERVAQKTVADWLAILQPADIWCAEVLNWADLVEEAAFQRLDLLQTVTRDDGVSIETTCTPMTFDGIRPKGRLAAPRVGEHSNAIRKEFGL